MAPSNTPRVYGYWRKPQSGGLYGLSKTGTKALFGGLILVILTMMTAGFLYGFLLLVGEALLGLGITYRDRHGRNLVDRVSDRILWTQSSRQGNHLYRSGPLGMTPWGTHQLPGIAAATRLSEHYDSYGRPFALVYTPATATYSVVFSTEPDGASLVDEDQVDAWVAGWGAWLNALSVEPGIKGCSVVVETVPDTGHRLRHEVEGNVDPAAPRFAKDVLADIVEAYPHGSSQIRAFVTLTFSAASSSTAKKRTVEEIGRDLGARLPALTDDLSTTGAGAARPLAPEELCELIRTAYDPKAAALIDEAHAHNQASGITWTEAGPAAHEAYWDAYRHDSAASVTWEMTRAPEGMVQSTILSRILAPHRDIVRKRVTLLFRPIEPGRAAAIVETDRMAAEFNATTKNRPTARSLSAARAALATAQEEASGAGLVNFAMLVTATVADEADLAEARAAIDNLGATARLTLRPCYGAQASAFAAALPIGFLLADLQSEASRLKESL